MTLRKDRAKRFGMLGAVGGLNSLMAVVAPVLGAPFYFCAALQAAALALAISHFRAEKAKQ